MNKILMISAILLITTGVYAQEEPLAEKDIPKQISTYVTTHFASSKIVKATKEKKTTGTEYEIKLDNDIALEFNGQKKIQEIDGHKKPLPNSVIPVKLLKYATVNYPSKQITGWEQDAKTDIQELKLDNDMELKFTRFGEPMPADKPAQ